MNDVLIASAAHLVLLIGTAATFITLLAGSKTTSNGQDALVSMKERRRAHKAAEELLEDLTND